MSEASVDNIILFIPLDMSIIDGAEARTTQPTSQTDNFLMYQKISEDKIEYNAVDLVYNPHIIPNSLDCDSFETIHPTRSYKTNINSKKQSCQEIEIDTHNTGDFTNVYVQLAQCNKNLEWASSTNIYCYNCCHSFTTRPWYLPIEYIDGCFIVLPIFCSPACVLRYNKDSNHADFSKRYSLFHLMYNIIHNSTVHDLPTALPRDILDIFGGPMSIQEYRQYSNTSKRTDDIDLKYPEIFSIVPQIKNIHRKKDTANNDYVLRRMKPPVVVKNTIFNTLLKKPSDTK